MNRKKVERNDEMIRLHWDELWTLEEVAEIYGLSRQRVSQIVGSSDREVLKKRTRHKRAQAKKMRLRGVATERVARRLGVSKATVYNWSTGDNKVGHVYGTPERLERDREIRSLRREGKSYYKIAKAVGVSPMTAWRVINVVEES